MAGEGAGRGSADLSRSTRHDITLPRKEWPRIGFTVHAKMCGKLQEGDRLFLADKGPACD
jgi:hypothetical protein